MKPALVLDFDASLREFHETSRIDLTAWQERIRFGCDWSSWQELEGFLDRAMPMEYGTVFMGSGDFHHVSHLLIKRFNVDERFDVVVCDNHPDNMVFPLGIHCGSWIKHLSTLPQVRTVHVAGIGSSDVQFGHAWENHLWPLYRRKVRYWTVGVDTRWASALGLSRVISSFEDCDSMLEALVATLEQDGCPVYLSIDKDVLSTRVARTNWDQGSMHLDHLHRLIRALSGRLIGSDVTGEISIHRYATRWKRILSSIDDQPLIAASELPRWQAQQLDVNRKLLTYLAEA